jgi:hypothetical protein
LRWCEGEGGKPFLHRTMEDGLRHAATTVEYRRDCRRAASVPRPAVLF